MLPQLSLLCLLPNFFHCLSTWKKKCEASRVDSPLSSFKKKREGRSHSKRHISQVPGTTAVLHYWSLCGSTGTDGGLSCFAEGHFSSGSWGLESTYHTIRPPPFLDFPSVSSELNHWPSGHCCYNAAAWSNHHVLSIYAVFSSQNNTSFIIYTAHFSPYHGFDHFKHNSHNSNNQHLQIH